MWRTQHGDRVLRGHEWLLFREGLADLWQWVEDTSDSADGYETGVDVFDALQPAQKLALLALVGRALSDQSVAPPALSAVSEGAVAAVFGHILRALHEETFLQEEDPEREAFLSWREH